jgi:hypothetical protein
MTHIRYGLVRLFKHLYSIMGCCYSTEIIDFDVIQPLVLRIHAGLATYSGTNERGRFQVCSYVIQLSSVLLSIVDIR